MKSDRKVEISKNYWRYGSFSVEMIDFSQHLELSLIMAFRQLNQLQNVIFGLDVMSVWVSSLWFEYDPLYKMQEKLRIKFDLSQCLRLERTFLNFDDSTRFDW